MSINNRNKYLDLFLKFLAQGWKAIVIVMLLELALAYLVGFYTLQDGVIKFFIDFTGAIIPIVGKAYAKEGVSIGGIQLYLALSFYLFLLKAVIIYLWLDKKSEHHSQLVISTETKVHAGSMGEYISAPLKDNDKYTTKPRSIFSRFIWSILTVAFAAVGIGIVFFWGGADSGASKSMEMYSHISAGGAVLWLGWSVEWVLFVAFLTGITMQVVKGYILSFKRVLIKRT